MEKNRIHPVKVGKGVRMSFARQKEVLEMPNLIEVQTNSYQWFLDEGLKEVFRDISPIADFGGHLSLEFVDFELCRDEKKYDIDQCRERDATYAAPLKVRVRLHNKETEEIKEHEIFMGDLPLMTATGTFIINGAERVIVSQLVRSPGIYYAISHDKVGSCIPQLLFLTVVHGWNMRQIRMMSSLSVLIEIERFRSLYFCVHSVLEPMSRSKKCSVMSQRFWQVSRKIQRTITKMVC